MTKEPERGYDETEVQPRVQDRGVTVAQAARNLDVAERVLRRWMRELTAAPAAAFPGNGQMRADLAETAALKKEFARLGAERDILKKGEPWCVPGSSNMSTAFLVRGAT